LSVILESIRRLILSGDIRISEHGYDELAEDDLSVAELLDSFEHAEIVEDYPNFPKGKCILLLQYDKNGSPVHTLWGIPKGLSRPAVLITAYRPDATHWDKTFLKRL